MGSRAIDRTDGTEITRQLLGVIAIVKKHLIMKYVECIHLFIHLFMNLLNPFDGQGKVTDRWTLGRVRGKVN